MIALGVMFLLIASVAITIYGFNAGKTNFWLPGLLAMLVLLVGFIAAVVDALKVKKLLTITHEGIIDNSSLSGAGFVPFDDIKDFVIITLYNRKAIAIIPKNIDGFLSKLNMVKRGIAKRNINFNLPPFAIQTYLAKDMEAEDILSLLKKRLSDYSSLYD
jgi:hypothetical protein